MSSPGNSVCCCHINTISCMTGVNSSTTTGNILMFERCPLCSQRSKIFCTRRCYSSELLSTKKNKQIKFVFFSADIRVIKQYITRAQLNHELLHCPEHLRSPQFFCGVCVGCSIISFMGSVLQIIVIQFFFSLLAIILTDILLTASNYQFGIFKLNTPTLESASEFRLLYGNKLNI